ncbi:MAG: hypothetical protein JWN64_20 [Parcubacteria group bacterium]|nr:hypothetical protein [Parcubacteria group bacterium]
MSNTGESINAGMYEPLSRDHTHGGVTYRVLCYPASDPNLTSAELGKKLAKEGALRVFRPSLDSTNTNVISEDQLVQRGSLGKLPLYVNSARPSNICILSEPGDTGLFYLGGCGLAVAAGKGMCVAAHVSRDSLFSKDAVRSGREPRMQESVVGAVAKYIQSREIDVRPGHMTFRMYFAIRTEDYPHSLSKGRHQKWNQKLQQWLGVHFPGEEIFKKIGEEDFLALSTWFAALARRYRFGPTGSALWLNSLDFARTTHPDKNYQDGRNPAAVIRLS